MNKTLTIPSKRFFRKAERIIKRAINELPVLYQDYYHVNDILTDDTPELQELIRKETGFDKFKISAGTSDMLAFKPYLNQIIVDIQNNAYYRSYNNPLGNTGARKALAIMENSKFGQEVYTYKNVGLTEGSTGAISQVFEYIKREKPNAEVIITSPTYYLYKFLARYYGLKYKEAFRIKAGKNTEFDSIKGVDGKITPQTQLIILVQPNNPTNQISSTSDLKKLLIRCKKQNILLLVDELFSDLMYNDSLFTSSDLIANEVNALDKIVIVKGYSKSKNLAGFRIGYLFSTNSKLMQAMDEISEQRQCFAGSSNYTGLIILDSFIQTILTLIKKGYSLDTALYKSKKQFQNFTLPIYGNSSIKKLVSLYMDYKNRLMQKYENYLSLALETLGSDIESFVPKISAFNTFIKVKNLNSVNQFDFCLNYYLTTGAVTQIGPCFAFNQKEWQSKEKLGFWLRLSYSRSNTNLLISSLEKLRVFKQLYLDNPSKFLITNYEF